MLANWDFDAIQKVRTAIGGAQRGKQFLSRGMAPRMPGELKSMGGDPVEKWISLEQRKALSWVALSLK